MDGPEKENQLQDPPMPPAFPALSESQDREMSLHVARTLLSVPSMGAVVSLVVVTT